MTIITLLTAVTVRRMALRKRMNLLKRKF